jgi:hypothetical protein
MGWAAGTAQTSTMFDRDSDRTMEEVTHREVTHTDDLVLHTKAAHEERRSRTAGTPTVLPMTRVEGSC